jgi:type VI secretion system protein ImpL
MLKRILGVLTARWLVTLIGAAALSVLIWLLGAMFSFGSVRPLETVTARAAAIGAVLLAWGLGNILAERKAARANRQMIRGLTAPAPPDPDAVDKAASAEEIGVLKQRLEDALTLLRRVQPNDHGGRR